MGRITPRALRDKPVTKVTRSVSRAGSIVIDRYRAIVFPNRIREQRRFHGFAKLMALSDRIPEIPYIRLSKIERGEVVARASELQRIAAVLDVSPIDLLTDVTAPDFDISRWAEPFQDGRVAPEEEEEFAVMLAAALRVLRNADPALTIAALEKEYGLPPVILSRLENAFKTFDRWNADTIASVLALFGVTDEDHLRAVVIDRYRGGELDSYVDRIADPTARITKTSELVTALREELGNPSPPTEVSASHIVARASPGPDTLPRSLPVLGIQRPGGLIEAVRTDRTVPATLTAGPNAFGLRLFRATLGPGLPANTILIVDPDLLPTVGGLAVIREGDSYRPVLVTFDRLGAAKGFSVSPEWEIDLDNVDPACAHAVIAAVFP